MGNRLDQKPFNQVKTKNSLEAERILVGGYKVSINFQVFHDNSDSIITMSLSLKYFMISSIVFDKRIQFIFSSN